MEFCMEKKALKRAKRRLATVQNASQHARHAILEDRTAKAIYLAAEKGNTEAIAKMLDVATDPQALLMLTDDGGRTALNWAAK